MSNWVQLTKLDGNDVFVNLERAAWISTIKNGQDEYTIIVYPGGEDDSIRVKEGLEKVSGLLTHGK